MPVMSFSVSESLRKAIKRLVKGNPDYNNNSVVMRAALTQLMDSYSDDILTDFESNSTETIMPITGNILIIVDKYNEMIEKKLIKIEAEWKDSIKAKNCFYYSNEKTIVYVVEDFINNFHSIITQINQIEDLKNIRFIIL